MNEEEYFRAQITTALGLTENQLGDHPLHEFEKKQHVKERKLMYEVILESIDNLKKELKDTKEQLRRLQTGEEIESDRITEMELKLLNERDDYKAKYEFMVERAVNEKLDGYRELAEKCAKLEQERDEYKTRLGQIGRIESWKNR